MVILQTILKSKYCEKIDLFYKPTTIHPSSLIYMCPSSELHPHSSTQFHPSNLSPQIHLPKSNNHPTICLSIHPSPYSHSSILLNKSIRPSNYPNPDLHPSYQNPTIYISIYPNASFNLPKSNHLRICPSIHLHHSIHPSIYPNPTITPSIYLSISLNLSFQLSTHLHRYIQSLKKKDILSQIYPVYKI